MKMSGTFRSTLGEFSLSENSDIKGKLFRCTGHFSLMNYILENGGWEDSEEWVGPEDIVMCTGRVLVFHKTEYSEAWSEHEVLTAHKTGWLESSSMKTHFKPALSESRK